LQLKPIGAFTPNSGVVEGMCLALPEKGCKNW